ncbi:MAG: hypothetical protein WA979_02730 [Pacificimonas sp.]
MSKAILTSPRIRRRIALLLGTGAVALLVFLISPNDLDQSTTAASDMPTQVSPSPPPARISLETPPASNTRPKDIHIPPPPGITLTGISASGVGGGAAMFSGDDGRQRRVRAGNIVSAGWTLDEVHPRHVILGRGGGGTARMDWAREGERVPTPETSRTLPSTETANTVFTSLTLSMEREDGGYRLTSIPAALNGLGLRPGDVLTRFDDDAFDDPERLQDLATRVTLQRGGTLRYVRAGKSRDIALPSR